MPPADSAQPPVMNWSLAKDGEAATPEQLLLDAVIRMRETRAGRVAVQIHLSRLQQHNRKNHYLRIAGETFDGYVKSLSGHLFTLITGDLFFLGRDVALADLMKLVDRLRLLFAEDPLTQYSEDEERAGFASYYDLATQYDVLLQDVQLLAKSAEKARAAREENRKAKAAKPEHGRPFQPQDLAKLITLLERADLGAIIRRQTACYLPESGIPEPRFEETFVSIDDLQRICTPEIDLLSDRWLFHYLSRTLDKRLLSFMVRDGIRDDLPFSLNLNIDTLLSPAFRDFDERVPSALRGHVVIELHKVDVFSDIGAFIFARDYVKSRGYKLCLDGLTHQTFPLFGRNDLELDYYKIYWAPEGLKTARAETLPVLREQIAGCGAARVLLCRCESEEAITAGHALGIRHFQGHMIDRLLNYTRAGKR